jgi:outer membrane protein TolC
MTHQSLRAGLLVLLSSTGLAQAQTLDYPAAVELALRQHPGMLASRARVAQAAAALDEAGAARLPSVTLSAALSRSDDPLNVFGAKLTQSSVTAADFVPSTLNHPDAANDFNTRIELAYPLYSGGRIEAGQRGAAAMLEAARSGDVAARQEIAFQVFAAYEGIHAAHAGIEVAGSALETAESALKSAEAQYRQGMGVKSDVLQARLAVEDARLARVEAGHARDAARDRLRQWLGLAPEDALEVGAQFDPGAPLDSAEARAQMRATHPRLVALRHRVDASRADHDAARAGRLPKVNLMARQDWHDDELGFDANTYTVAGMVSWSAFDGGAARAGADRAQARGDEARAELARVENEVAFQIKDALRAASEATTRLESRTLAVAQAEEAQRLVRKRYDHGLATMVELLAARTRHSKARAELVSARYQLKLRRAGVLLAQGRMEPETLMQESR